ncbi:MAG: immune inhibitor A, partial [Candidatus Eremiobacteraeota bacterium]|nr:immune inhibitor A [Candidatus Eremiobacteraeota bacterium]
APNDFGAAEARTNGVTLNWTATGDDGWCGNASGYELRVSDRPIVDGEAAQGQVSFDQATPVGAASPSATGTIESANISLVPAGSERQLYFALKVKDNVGNLSEIRTASANIPAASLAFEDNIDGQAANWTPDQGWAQVEEAGRGKVWTDSPDGQYGSGANSSLTTRAISLENYTNSTLIFDAKHSLESGYDKVHVEASTDGENWSSLQQLTGDSEWATHSLDLSAFDGQNVQLRFRLTSDSSVNSDGFYLDNVVIAGDHNPPPPPPQEPPQQPPSQG